MQRVQVWHKTGYVQSRGCALGWSLGTAAANMTESMRRGSVLSGQRIKIINVSQSFLGAGIKAQYRGLVLVRTE